MQSELGDMSVMAVWNMPRFYRMSGHVTLTGKPKRGYLTAEDAQDRDLWAVYKCQVCDLWHRGKPWKGYDERSN